jgi:hypothetical protein
MPRHTRRSQPKNGVNHTEGPSIEDNIALQGSTDSNTTLQCALSGQNQTTGHIQGGVSPATMSGISDH